MKCCRRFGRICTHGGEIALLIGALPGINVRRTRPGDPDVPRIEEAVRARNSRRVPTVLTRYEVRASSVQTIHTEWESAPYTRRESVVTIGIPQLLSGMK